MMMRMIAFAGWLRLTPISVALQHQERWMWPFCESLHFIGLCLLVGVAGFFDLRLLGMMKRIPVKAALDMMPWAIAGFAINLITGTTFFIAEPVQYCNNPTWWAKVCFLVVAGLNAIFFQTILSARVLTLEPDGDTPMSFKIVGAVSLITWLGVLYCGRMLPFIGASVSAGL
jgi:hypothetical protein